MKRLLPAMLAFLMSAPFVCLTSAGQGGADHYQMITAGFETYVRSTAGEPQWQWLFQNHLPDFAEAGETGNTSALYLTGTAREDGLVSEVLGEEWSGNGWENSYDEFYTYDQNNFLVQRLKKEWDGEWVNDTRYDITNNAMGLAEEVFLYMWNNDSVSWDLMARMTYTYDPQGNMQVMLMEFWMDPAWVGYMKMLYTYNPYGISEIITQGYDYIQGLWLNSKRDLFSYDANGWPVEELSQEWIEEEWRDKEKEIMTYNGQGQHVESYTYQWLENTWVNYLHFTYSFDGSGNLVLELEQHWQTGAWIDYRKYLYTYITDASVTEILELKWNGIAWENSFRETFSYIPVGVDEIPRRWDQGSLKVYPNPGSDLIHLQYSLADAGPVSVAVCDLSGRELAVIEKRAFFPAGNCEMMWNVPPALKPGMYILSLRAGDEHLSVMIRIE